MKPTPGRIGPLCASVAATQLFLAALAGQQPPPEFSEKLTVTEVELVVALPEGGAAREDLLLVREGGEPRPATPATRAAAQGPSPKAGCGGMSEPAVY